MVDVQEWPIPAEVVPATRVCVSFTIPDNDTYRQILVGWMNQLCYQYNWERDTGHNAVICSNLFKQSRAEMIASLTEGCMGDDMYFRMRISPGDGCTSEAQYELDGDWIPFMSQCCCDTTQTTLHRVNPTTNQLEISTDGGTTWIPDPESPIVTTVTEWPAPVPSGAASDKCYAAANGKEHIEDFIAGSSEWLGTAATILELAVGVCTAFLALVVAASVGTLAPEAAALATAIWAAAAAAFEIGQTAFDAYWTNTERDKITCALFCTIGDDGAFTQAQYDNFIATWTAMASPSPAFNLVLNTIKAGGAKSLNNLCSYGVPESADCSGCGCGGCDLTDWIVQIGTENVPARTDTSIVVAAAASSGGYAVRVHSQNINNCCCFMTYDILGGDSGITTIAYVPCGATNTDDTNILFAYTGQSTNLFYLFANAPFTARIYSEGDCP